MAALCLELWLIGTPAELDAAIALLRCGGRLAETNGRTALFGADRGRYRTYLRLSVPAASAITNLAQPAT